MAKADQKLTTSPVRPIIAAAVGVATNPPKSVPKTAADIRDAVDEAMRARVDAGLPLEGDDARPTVHAAIVRGQRKAREEVEKAREEAERAREEAERAREEADRAREAADKFDRRGKKRQPDALARAIIRELDA